MPLLVQISQNMTAMTRVNMQVRMSLCSIGKLDTQQSVRCLKCRVGGATLWYQSRYLPDSPKQAGLCICLEDESFVLSICIQFTPLHGCQCCYETKKKRHCSKPAFL